MYYFRSIASIFVLLPLALAIAVGPNQHVLAQARTSKPKPIRVAMIGAFQDPDGELARAAKLGLELARKEIRNNTLQIDYRDNRNSPIITETQFRNLAKDRSTQLVISVGSGESRALAGLADKLKLPLCAWTHEYEPLKSKRYVIRTALSRYELGRELAREAEQRGYRNVGVVTAEKPRLEQVRDGFVDFFNPERIKAKNIISPYDQDFSKILLKGKQQKTTAFALFLEQGQAARFAKQAREHSMLLDLFGTEVLQNRAELKLSQDALLKAWFLGSLPRSEFNEKVIPLGSDLERFVAALHYDLGHLIVAKVRADMDRDRVLANLLSEREFEGVLGKYESLMSSEDQFIRPIPSVYQVTVTGFQKLR